MSKDSKHVLHFSERHLKPGETVLAWVEGYIGEMMGSGKDAQHNGALIVTDHRVVFCRKGMLGEVLETIPLEKLSSVERRVRLTHVTIQLHTSHDALAFKTFESPELQPVVDAIEKGRAPANIAAPAPSASADPIEALRRLGELREAGVITDAEFASKKAELLSRL